MSIKLMSLVWQDHTGTLTGTEKAVLLRMADFAADNGTQIFPTLKRLSADLSFSERTIQYAINNLVKKKYLTKTIRTSRSVHISNLYRINTAVLIEAAAVVDKVVDKSGINGGGGADAAPRVVQNTSEGGAPVACDPPLIPHIDPPTEQETIDCLKNERQELLSRQQKQSKVSNKEKAQIMRDMKKLIQGIKMQC